MLARQTKRMFYNVAGPLMRANGVIYRSFLAPRNGHQVVKVQLGPGQKNYFPGWINVDANMFTGKCDVWADLRNKLPFRDSTVDVFYSHHMIEHLPDLAFHFHELHRCLKPGGVFRIGGPNGDTAIRKFAEGDADWFIDYPDTRRSLGGRFENFIFCRQEHLTILTYSWLHELAAEAGFEAIKPGQPGELTHFPECIDAEVLAKEPETTPECPHTLIIEGRKSA
ncbi:MAG TPA: methyltransferase domain-containing protein [Isosphaeraceae bacterium]|nr:methyltransferase domain-containing protein [Isosphaeraceae bacterium]